MKKNWVYFVAAILGGIYGFAETEFNKSLCYYAPDRVSCYAQKSSFQAYLLDIILNILIAEIICFVLLFIWRRLFTKK